MYLYLLKKNLYLQLFSPKKNSKYGPDYNFYYNYYEKKKPSEGKKSIMYLIRKIPDDWKTQGRENGMFLKRKILEMINETFVQPILNVRTGEMYLAREAIACFAVCLKMW